MFLKTGIKSHNRNAKVCVNAVSVFYILSPWSPVLFPLWASSAPLCGLGTPRRAPCRHTTCLRGNGLLLFYINRNPKPVVIHLYIYIFSKTTLNSGWYFPLRSPFCNEEYKAGTLSKAQLRVCAAASALPLCPRVGWPLTSMKIRARAFLRAHVVTYSWASFGQICKSLANLNNGQIVPRLCLVVGRGIWRRWSHKAGGEAVYSYYVTSLISANSV